MFVTILPFLSGFECIVQVVFMIIRSLRYHCTCFIISTTTNNNNNNKNSNNNSSNNNNKLIITIIY